MQHLERVDEGILRDHAWSALELELKLGQIAL
jgi:hypothetical protein